MKSTPSFPINARNFHKFLGSTASSGTWIRQIQKRYLWKEGVDFIIERCISPANRPIYEYWWTYSAARKVARKTSLGSTNENLKYVKDMLKESAANVPIVRPHTSETIPVKPTDIGGNSVNTVDARELHGFLGSKQEFTNWIKNRINTYGFEEGVDFVTFDRIIKRKIGVRGAAKTTEYTLTLDMAKELSMVERTERGRQARRYFIECERKLQTITASNPSEMLRMLADIRYESFGYHQVSF